MDRIDSDAATEKVKRKRSGHACIECRKIKSKCSGKMPCLRCQISELTCSFAVSRRGKRKKGEQAKQQDENEDALLPPSAALPAIQWPLPGTTALDLFSFTQDITVSSILPTGTDVLAEGAVASTSASQSRFADNPPRQLSAHLSPPPPLQFSSQTSPPHQKRPSISSPILEELQQATEDSINPLRVLAQASIGLHEAIPLDDPIEPSLAQERMISDAPQDPMAAPVFLRRREVLQRKSSKLIMEGILSPEEIQDLFDIYFTHMDRHLPLLSKELHTPLSTSVRSPFLLTCICTVASRFYSKRRGVDLHEQCHHAARREAFDLYCLGVKSLDLVQGFLLLTKWNQPSDNYEEDMTFQMSGIAMRIAIDLDFHKKESRDMIISRHSTLTDQERLDRRIELERAWQVLYVTDHSVSVQMGKPRILSHGENLAQHEYQDVDKTLTAMIQLHQIVGPMVDTLLADRRAAYTPVVTARVTRILITSYATQLENWHRLWLAPGVGIPGAETRPTAFYYHYYKILLSSFGIQRTSGLEESAFELTQHCIQSYQEALKLIKVAQNWHLANSLTYALNPHFVTLSYVATFLLKFLSPVYSHIIPDHDIYPVVTAVVGLLESAAVDRFHAPALYAKFLRLLLRSKQMTSSAQTPAVPGGFEFDNLVERFASPEPLQSGAACWISRQGTPTPVEDQSFLPSSFETGMFWEDMLLPGLNEPLISLAGNSLQLSGPDGSSWFLDGF